MNRSTPGLPVQHQLPEFTETHVHRVSDANPAVSSSVVPFSSCPQSLLASALVFPGGASGKEPACQCRRYKRSSFDPWVRKIPWRREWLPTQAFLPGEYHGQRNLAGYSPWGHKELDVTENSRIYFCLCSHMITVWSFCLTLSCDLVWFWHLWCVSSTEDYHGPIPITE